MKQYFRDHYILHPCFILHLEIGFIDRYMFKGNTSFPFFDCMVLNRMRASDTLLPKFGGHLANDAIFPFRLYSIN